MTLSSQTADLLKRSPALGPLVYVAAVLAMLVICVEAAGYVENRLQSLSADRMSLALLKNRFAAMRAPPTDPNMPQGSPFIQGPTVTIAGAALLERVSTAVAGVGGQVLSSQVTLEPVQDKSALIHLTIESDLDQPSLQKLLYNLEAGMPFLFVDQLDTESLEPATGVQSPRLHVILSVHGRWLGER